MNQLKNIFKIFIKNLKHIIYLLKEKEIPKKSIYSLNFKILNYKNFSNKSETPKLILSSKSHRVSNSRLKEFNEMFSLLSDYEIVYFNHRDRDRYMKHYWGQHKIYEVYKRAYFHQMRADIFRYCFLYNQGGTWLDFKSLLYFSNENLFQEDIETLLLISSNKIEDQLKIKKQEISITKSRMITNWFISSKKEADFIKYVINDISVNYHKFIGKRFLNPKKAILELTGPHRITKLFYDYIHINQNWEKQILFLDEHNYKINFISEFGRSFSIFDGIFYKHYSQLENKKILKSNFFN